MTSQTNRAGRRAGRRISREAQDRIDMCVDRCTWPDNPAMCDLCKGRPERIRKKAEVPPKEQEPPKPEKTQDNVLFRAAVLWLEWRAAQPDNPDPERTWEILRGVIGNAR